MGHMNVHKAHPQSQLNIFDTGTYALGALT